MIDWADAVRGLHMAACMVPAGGCVFLLLMARPAARVSLDSAAQLQAVSRWIDRTTAWSLIVALLTGLLWLAAEAMNMSGRPFSGAMSPAVIGVVISKTLFGRLWQFRGLVLFLLAIWLFFRARGGESAPADTRIGLVLGLALVLSLAWAGHAAAVEGASGWVLLVSQLVHLAASAGWLGSLLPLAMVLSRARRRPTSWGFAAAVTRRFSPVGQVCVAALVVSGIANGLVLVGTVPALVGTHYGRLLLAKLAFFAFMCLLAAANRFRLTPALDMRPGRAVRGLWRNALLEIALGIGVLGIVGALGASTPAAHDQPVWPFPVAFSLQALDQDQTLLVPLALTGLLAALALAAVCFGWLKRHPAVAGVGLGGLGAAIVVAAQLSAVPAYPTSFQHSPLRYTARAVAAGGHTYATFCTACHGEAGHGDGSAAASLSIKPANLTEPHLFHHGEGTLFWWIGHGIANTPMPGFADQIDETKRWELIQFLRANAEAEEASSLTASVDPPSTVVAPDFEFQIAKGPQETLKDLRGGTNVLLVFYSLPASRDRLTALAAAASDLAQQHLRIVAVPMSEAGQAPPSVPFATDAAPEIVAAYALYRRGNPAASAAPPPHEEFLIDRAGYLRARWTLGAADGWGDLARLKDALVQLNAERPRPPAPEGHVHG